MTFIILTGGIDLSIGSVVALAGIIVGVSQVHWGFSEAGTLGAFGSVFLAASLGTALGAINGGLISTLRIAPFVITLGMMVVARGLALIFSGGASISPMGDSLAPIAEGYLSPILTIFLLAGSAIVLFRVFRRQVLDGVFPALLLGLVSYSFLTYKGFPILALFLLISLAISAVVLARLSFGRAVYAIGSNEKAAYWAGVPVRKIKWAVYTIMGLFAGISGVLLSARLNGADPNAGQLFELDAIAAVVIGGSSLKGGRGTILGSFIGAIMIATLNNGMDLLGVPSFYQMVMKGVIIIVTVSIDKNQRE
jgi:ribose/xylose/arabinose/galactoside ABC-type transport system permease subunit